MAHGSHQTMHKPHDNITSGTRDVILAYICYHLDSNPSMSIHIFPDEFVEMIGRIILLTIVDESQRYPMLLVKCRNIGGGYGVVAHKYDGTNLCQRSEVTHFRVVKLKPGETYAKCHCSGIDEDAS